MISNSSLNKLKDELEVIGRTSEIGLWWIYADVRDQLGSASAEKTKGVVLDLLKDMLMSNRLTPIDFSPESVYSIWDETPIQAFERIKREMNDLNRVPDIGDVCMFVSPGHDLLKDM